MKKERILPWQTQGRWYHAFVESNGSTITITDADDISVHMSGAVLQFPEGFKVLQWVVDHDNNTGTANDYIMKKKLYADGSVGVYLPVAGQFTAADVFVFGYYE